jgi:hypothetical protein
LPIAGPSYKRGPPKGYIHAIEQRWHQVEALIGAILQCPDERVRSIVVELKQDDLAREILARVDSGPYVCVPFLYPQSFEIYMLDIFRDLLEDEANLQILRRRIFLHRF